LTEIDTLFPCVDLLTIHCHIVGIIGRSQAISPFAPWCRFLRNSSGGHFFAAAPQHFLDFRRVLSSGVSLPSSGILLHHFFVVVALRAPLLK
jgi:hypothetical protein